MFCRKMTPGFAPPCAKSTAFILLRQKNRLPAMVSFVRQDMMQHPAQSKLCFVALRSGITPSYVFQVIDTHDDFSRSLSDGFLLWILTPSLVHLSFLCAFAKDHSVTASCLWACWRWRAGRWAINWETVTKRKPAPRRDAMIRGKAAAVAG